MVLFMIGDWLLDAAGSGDREVGLAVHSNWPLMAQWRFVASAVLAIGGIFLTWVGAREAMELSRRVERPDSKGSRFWGKVFRFGFVCLLVYGMGFHVILCLFPIFFKTILSLGATFDFAAEAVNASAMSVVAPLMIVYIICDLGISIAWYYMILKKEWKLSYCALLCCPLSTLLIDFALKAIPLQFFKDFTVAFESLGWLTMFSALALHAKRAGESE